MLDRTFELNGNGYRCNTETLQVLRSVIPSAQDGDSSAVMAVMILGEMSGRIVEMSEAEYKEYSR